MRNIINLIEHLAVVDGCWAAGRRAWGDGRMGAWSFSGGTVKLRGKHTNERNMEIRYG